MKNILVQGPTEYFEMQPAIDSTRLRLSVGTTPRTGSKVVRIDGSSYLSLGNREERKAVRRLAQQLLELCDAHEPKPRVAYTDGPGMRGDE